MSKFNSLLAGRFKSSKRDKVSQLVKQSHEGNLSSFAGVFRLAPENKEERANLETLLKRYATQEVSWQEDLSLLMTLTSEIKAIHNQAILLHGARIKKAQQILTKYRDGAFTSWLIQTYGNRQTPYNFLQYYELYHSLPTPFKELLDHMPRQAIYSLSSRSISQEEKIAFIKQYQGESKRALLDKLREEFPLAEKDKRNTKYGHAVLLHLKHALNTIKKERCHLGLSEKKHIRALIAELERCL